LTRNPKLILAVSALNEFLELVKFIHNKYIYIYIYIYIYEDSKNTILVFDCSKKKIRENKKLITDQL
jgi:hypothetical protein